MKFAIAIYAPPSSQDQARAALEFAEAVVSQGHNIYRLFFFNDGVLNGVALESGTGTEPPLWQRWQRLVQAHNLDAVVCVTSAKKRGVVGQDATQSPDSPCLPVADGFTIGGLGQLIDAAVNADRMITFGN